MTRNTVEEQDGTMEDGDCSQMGSTGGEGFMMPSTRRHLHNCDENEYIRGQNDQQTACLIEYSDNKTVSG